jgi:hypothetical protein
MTIMGQASHVGKYLSLSPVDVRRRQWAVEPGSYHLAVGPSYGDERLTTDIAAEGPNGQYADAGRPIIRDVIGDPPNK